MAKIFRSLFGIPSPSKMAARQQAAINQQIEAQRRLQREAEERAEARRREEEQQALQKAAAEYRSRLNASQGRRANRVAENTRELLNRMGLLG